MQKSESTLTLGLVITALFRLIILAANAAFANRMGQLFREQRIVDCPQSVATPPKLYLVKT